MKERCQKRHDNKNVTSVAYLKVKLEKIHLSNYIYDKYSFFGTFVHFIYVDTKKTKIFKRIGMKKTDSLKKKNKHEEQER